MRVYVVRKWPLRGGKSFCMLEYHTNVCGYCATCISCKVRKGPACREDHSCVVQTIAAVNNIDAPMLTRVWQELEYRIDVCHVTHGAHIEQL
jgi:hypothetical protein